ncbi:hypothetical protein HOK51_06125 [Candidatus Woesearchaeota archaeon]|jgi:hypothetical protein|nr:hypothetical protein [Candidatus Woesearchaeota archaeon]MBT6519402.1 hypothetical protein [Candidatus Woesearchaeota archaeon]MBT7368074.1 hypothetical protein [Candidatus Woesearchaeota archaeon]
MIKKQKTGKRTCKNKLVLLFTIIFLLILIVLSSSFACALGVIPSRKYYDFESNSIINNELTVMKDPGSKFTAQVYAKGELAEYISFEQELITSDAGSGSFNIPYTINLPTNIESAGNNMIEIVVEEVQGEGIGIGTLLSISAQVIIKVPYPDKYAEGKISIKGNKVGEPVYFTNRVYNLGSEDIDSVHANVEIIDPDDNKVGEVKSDSTNIATKSETNIVTSWIADVPSGEYTSVSTIYYDSATYQIRKKFSIGLMEIALYNLNVSSFNLGEVAKFDIALLNLWNTKLDNVYIKFGVYDDSGKRLGEYQTLPVSIAARGISSTDAFWYTKDIAPGKYKLKLEIYYGDNMFEKEVEIIVGMDYIEPVMEAISGQIVSRGADGKDVNIAQPKSRSDKEKDNNVLFISVIVISVLMSIIVNVFLIKHYFNRRDKKNNKNNPIEVYQQKNKLRNNDTQYTQLSQNQSILNSSDTSQNISRETNGEQGGSETDSNKYSF